MKQPNGDFDSMSLAGLWKFALDPCDVGCEEKWFLKEIEDNEIKLPGSLQEQGFGNNIALDTPWVCGLYDPQWYVRPEYEPYSHQGNIKVPFCLQPKKHYIGPAWYQNEINIPASWQGKRIVLSLERPHWKTTLWLDDAMLGTQDSISTPHVYGFPFAGSGRHRLTIRVDNQNFLNIRPDSHSITDSTGASWNGIVGKIELSATSPVWMDDIQVYPDLSDRSTNICVKIGNMTGKAGHGVLEAGGKKVDVKWNETGGEAQIKINLGENSGLWDQYHANLQHVAVSLIGTDAEEHKTVTFGMREIKACGNRFLVNGIRTHFRGTHDGGCFPLTGFPAMDFESWKKIISVCQEHGLNLIRFHSWCPPEAAFAAADELGFYFQPECGLWPNLNPGSDVEKWLYEETDKILKAYGNHPSFVLFSCGNEPAGKWYAVLPKWAHHCTKQDARHLYAFCTGREAPVPREGMQAYEYWNNQPDAQFLTVIRVAWDALRGPSKWDGLDYRKNVNHLRMPVMGHEVGQWCSYPNYNEIEKYTGFLQPFNYEIFQDSLIENGMADKAHDFYMASGKFQLLCYKEEIEANLRTPGMGGFELLDLHDYPGQGTSFIGIRDMFWDEKEYASPKQFRCFCDTTVLLARFEKRIFHIDETAVIPIEGYHYEEQPLAEAAVWWKTTSLSGNIVENGEIPGVTLPLDGGIPIGVAVLDFKKYGSPAQYRLSVGIKNTDFENSWDFWLYPTECDVSTKDITVTESFEEAREILARGGKALYLAASELSWDNPPVSFEPVFWNRQLNLRWNGSLGLLCDPAHPALAGFPTEEFSNWQWLDVIKHSCRAINLTRLPAECHPIVQVIDDWNRNWKLGILFECKIGNGRLMICGADLRHDMENRPAARQFLHSVLNYMSGVQFNPVAEISAQQLEGLLFDCNIMQKLGAKAYSKDESEGFEAQNVIDGDPVTSWMSSRESAKSGCPHEIFIRLREEHNIRGFILMQQQKDYRCMGHVKHFHLYAGCDEKNLNLIYDGELKSSIHQQKFLLQSPINANIFRFTALDSCRGSGRAALAEFAVITSDSQTCATVQKSCENTGKQSTKLPLANDLDDPTQ